MSRGQGFRRKPPARPSRSRDIYEDIAPEPDAPSAAPDPAPSGATPEMRRARFRIVHGNDDRSD